MHGGLSLCSHGQQRSLNMLYVEMWLKIVSVHVHMLSVNLMKSVYVCVPSMHVTNSSSFHFAYQAKFSFLWCLT